jgi:hypothetical protein
MLAGQTRISIETMLSKNKKTVHPDPNESTLLTLPRSSSTLQSSYKPIETAGEVGKLRGSSCSTLGSSSMSAKSVREESQSGTSESLTDPSSSKAVQTLIQGLAVEIAGRDQSHAAGLLILHLEHPVKATSLVSLSTSSNIVHALECVLRSANRFPALPRYRTLTCRVPFTASPLVALLPNRTVSLPTPVFATALSLRGRSRGVFCFLTCLQAGCGTKEPPALHLHYF